MKRKACKIVGGGVMGSFVAHELATAGFDVTIYTDPTSRFSAPQGGIGIIENPELPGSDSGLVSKEDLHAFYCDTDSFWRSRADDPTWNDLVKIRPVTYVYRDPDKDRSFVQTLTPDCQGRLLEAEQLDKGLQDAGFVCGITFMAPVISPFNVLGRMHEQLMELGVKFEYRRVASMDEFKDEPLVIETTGLGRRVFFGDSTIRPRRGQTLVLKGAHGLQGVISAPGPKISFGVTPWDDETLVLGGTKELDNFEEQADADTAELLLDGCAQLAPCVRKLRVHSSPVGFRPLRDQLLFECVVLADGRIVWIVNGLSGGGWSSALGLARNLRARCTAA